MATSKNTFQYKQTISINRDNFMNKIVLNDQLSKKDLRVILHLLTHLDSINPKEISKKQIADDLNIGKKDVNNAIETLMAHEIIDTSSSGSVRNGYLILF